MSKIVLLDNGKATVTPEGYVLTQPFDFKNALCAPNSIYQTISGLNLTQCSFHWWFNTDYLGSSPALQINIQTNAGPFNGRIYLNQIFRFVRTVYDGGYIDMGWGYPYEAFYGIGSNLFMYTFDNGTITLWVNGNQCQTFAIPGSIEITAISYNCANDISDNGMSLNYRTTYFALYERILGVHEIRYLVNQRSGNDPQNVTDLLSLCTDLQCEAIDFSLAQDGSDIRPAFRDRSGNDNHQYLEGMPVGTVSEQVNYINSQLVPFLK